MIRQFMAESEQGEQAGPDTLTKLVARIRECHVIKLIGHCISYYYQDYELISKNMKDIPDNDNMIAIENHCKSDIYSFNPEPTSIDLDKDLRRVF